MITLPWWSPADDHQDGDRDPQQVEDAGEHGQAAGLAEAGAGASADVDAGTGAGSGRLRRVQGAVLGGQDQQSRIPAAAVVRTIEAISHPLPSTPRLSAVAKPRTGTARPMPA